jgi:hypothetical protein
LFAAKPFPQLSPNSFRDIPLRHPNVSTGTANIKLLLKTLLSPRRKFRIESVRIRIPSNVPTHLGGRRDDELGLFPYGIQQFLALWFNSRTLHLPLLVLANRFSIDSFGATNEQISIFFAAVNFRHRLIS